MSNSFSRRNGFKQLHPIPISIRTDAPDEIREVIVVLAYEYGFSPKPLREVVCRALRKLPDKSNWTEYPNINNEIQLLISSCDWYRVYDVIEAIANKMRDEPFSFEYEKFEAELNDYFAENGVGWQLCAGKIEVRGDAVFENATHQAISNLHDGGFATAGNEVSEALHDLSRRPSPDITGAIQHSMAALECVARAVTGDHKATLGEIMKHHRDLMPKPLDDAVSKLWGFASENARHINEGRTPPFEEAELVVTVVASICTYLVKKGIS
jgi:AbiJ N-terminal domain 4